MTSIDIFLDKNLNLTEKVNNYTAFFSELPFVEILIDKSIEFKSDLIAYRFYGSESYWWCVLLLNDLNSNQSLKQGIKIKLYNKTDIDQFLYTLNTEENVF